WVWMRGCAATWQLCVIERAFSARCSMSSANRRRHATYLLVRSRASSSAVGRPLHRLGDRLGIAEVVLLPSRVRAHIFSWHQPSVMTKRCEFAAQMVCADASLHADQARRQVGEPCFYLAARPLLTQHDRATPIQTHDVKRVFADIDTDHGDLRIKLG